MKEALRKNAKNYANQDFLETLLFYFGEYRTEVTPNTIAKIFSEECAKVAFELAKEYNEDDDDYVIPTKKDLTSEVKSITIVLEREETKRWRNSRMPTAQKQPTTSATKNSTATCGNSDTKWCRIKRNRLRKMLVERGGKNFFKKLLKTPWQRPERCYNKSVKRKRKEKWKTSQNSTNMKKKCSTSGWNTGWKDTRERLMKKTKTSASKNGSPVKSNGTKRKRWKSPLNSTVRLSPNGRLKNLFFLRRRRAAHRRASAKFYCTTPPAFLSRVFAKKI